MKRMISFISMMVMISVNVVAYIPEDKIMHFMGGALIAKYCIADFKMDEKQGLAVVAGISALKEYADTQKEGGYFDNDDITAALLGATCVYLFDGLVDIRVTEKGYVFKIKVI